MYKKPEAHIEMFTLNQSIASCGTYGSSELGKPSYGDSSSCGWDLGNVVVWSDYPNVCTQWWPSDLAYEGVCYNNPNGGVSAFGSQ